MRALSSLRRPRRRPWYLVSRLGPLGAPLAFGLVGLGLLAIAVTWFKASGTVFLPEQIAYLASGATVGIAFVALGVGMLIVSSAREDTAGTQDVLVRILDAVELLAAASVPDAGSGRIVWRIDDTAHVPGCLEVDPVQQPELLVLTGAPPADLDGCPVCRPWTHESLSSPRPTAATGAQE